MFLDLIDIDIHRYETYLHNSVGKCVCLKAVQNAVDSADLSRGHTIKVLLTIYECNLRVLF